MKRKVKEGEKFQRNGIKYVAKSTNQPHRCSQCSGYVSKSACIRMPECFLGLNEPLIFVPAKSAKL